MALKKTFLLVLFISLIGSSLPSSGKRIEIDGDTSLHVISIATALTGLYLIAKKSDSTLGSILKAGGGLTLMISGAALIVALNMNLSKYLMAAPTR